MNKQEYLNALEKALLGLPNEEINKSLDFYSEMIEDAVENGETEAEAVERLGSVDETAQKIINEMPLAKLVKENVKKHHWSGSQIALVIILSPLWVSLASAAFAAGISLYLALWAIVASVFAASVGFAAGGVVLLAAAPCIGVSDMPKAILSLGTGLTLAGGSVLVFFIAAVCSKLIIKLTAYIIRKIKNIFVRKG